MGTAFSDRHGPKKELSTVSSASSATDSIVPTSFSISNVTAEARSCGATQQPAVAGRPLRALRVMTFTTFTKAKRRFDARKRRHLAAPGLASVERANVLLVEIMAYRRAGLDIHGCCDALSEYTGQRWIDCANLLRFLRRHVLQSTRGAFTLSNCMVVTDSMFAMARDEESQLRMAAEATQAGGEGSVDADVR